MNALTFPVNVNRRLNISSDIIYIPEDFYAVIYPENSMQKYQIARMDYDDTWDFLRKDGQVLRFSAIVFTPDIPSDTEELWIGGAYYFIFPNTIQSILE